MKHGRRGQSLIESTLVLAAFLLLLAGIVQVSTLLMGRQALVGRVRDAARWAATKPYNETEIRNLVLFGEISPPANRQPLTGVSPADVSVLRAECPGPNCRVRIAAGAVVETAFVEDQPASTDTP